MGLQNVVNNSIVARVCSKMLLFIMFYVRMSQNAIIYYVLEYSISAIWCKFLEIRGIEFAFLVMKLVTKWPSMGQQKFVWGGK